MKFIILIFFIFLQGCSTLENNKRIISSLQNCVQIKENVLNQGDSWEFSGKMCNDYLPSEEKALTRKSMEIKSAQVSGGFTDTINVFSTLGTFINIVPEAEIENTLRPYSKQIPTDILKHLKYIMADRDVFYIVRSFLNDGGQFTFMPESGRYTASPLMIRICVDQKNKAEDIDRLMFHELLHYAFDKMDIEIYEVKTSGGEDHMLIEALEGRFAIVDLARRGLPLTSPAIFPNYTYLDNTVEESRTVDFFVELDLKEIKEKASSPDFYTNLVKSSLIPVLSSNDLFLKRPRPGMFYFQERQVQDLAFIYAQNAAAYMGALKIALYMATQTNESDILKVFARNDTKQIINYFIKRFYSSQNDPYTNKPFATLQSFTASYTVKSTK